MTIDELLRPPRAQTAAAGWADRVEIECLRRDDGNASAGDVRGWLQREPTPDDADDIDLEELPSDEELEDEAQSPVEPPDRVASPAHERTIARVLDELMDREQHAGSGWHRYPFELSDDGQQLTFRPTSEERALLYLFLLLSTRLNMKSNSKHANLDATQLFEQLCAEVARGYWGGEPAEAMVFGTARVTGGGAGTVASFQDALAEMCRRTGEGGGVRPRPGHTWSEKDDKLDLVVWRSFADGRCAKLWGFGQCKTGSSWGASELTQLQPEAFCGSWLQTPPPVLPVRLFFVAARCGERDRSEWEDLVRRGGVVFDRCRIVDQCPELGEQLGDDIRTWTAAASHSAGLRWP